MPTYTSQYPPAHNSTYVKATTNRSAFEPFLSTNPALPLTGAQTDNEWMSVLYALTNQRFHIDLGEAKIIRRIYYENSHHIGEYTTRGAENFTFWGSNNAAAFAELTYAIDTNWTQLTIAQSTFDIHISADQADPKYILVTNAVAYRYYAFKIADNYGDEYYMGTRHLNLMTEDGYPPAGGIMQWFFTEAWKKHDRLWTPKLILPKEGYSY